jgi:hypothetical protein
MNAKSLVLAFAIAMPTAPALAHHCPIDMQEIDAALAEKPQLTPAQLAEVKKYRAEGEAFHKAGQHDQSVEVLAKAKAILGL